MKPCGILVLGAFCWHVKQHIWKSAAFIAALHHKVLSPPLLSIIAHYVFYFFLRTCRTFESFPSSITGCHRGPCCTPTPKSLRGPWWHQRCLAPRAQPPNKMAWWGWLCETWKRVATRATQPQWERRRESLQCRLLHVTVIWVRTQPRVNGNSSGIFAYISHVFFRIKGQPVTLVCM